MAVDYDFAELKEPESHKGIGWFELTEAEALEIEPIWRLVLNMAFI